MENVIRVKIKQTVCGSSPSDGEPDNVDQEKSLELTIPKKSCQATKLNLTVTEKNNLQIGLIKIVGRK